MPHMKGKKAVLKGVVKIATRESKKVPTKALGKAVVKTRGVRKPSVGVVKKPYPGRKTGRPRYL